jgi:dTDP-4-amino-4,6-dideoxygalactose transaminase
VIFYENLAEVNKVYRDELVTAATKVFDGGMLILGTEVSSFESEFSTYVGTKYCVGVANGLDALTLSIIAQDFPAGAEIIVASNTYIATILAVLNANCIPVLVEPDLGTYNLDPAKISEKITSKTRAICVTHLYGKSCDMSQICTFASQYGLTVIEDCAQSHGAHHHGRMTGAFGIAGCFSFYPTKNLGALGDGGAICTSDDDMYDRLIHLRNYGSRIKYHNQYIGYNSRLDEIQAAFLRVKLPNLNQVTDHKRKLANVYFKYLDSNKFILPKIEDFNYDVFHIFPIRCANRNELKAFLESKGIKTEIHYPIPPHRQAALKNKFADEFELADLISQSIISLPISFAHKESDIEEVCYWMNRF